MKVWITLYALTEGIIEIEAEESINHPDMIYFEYGCCHGESKNWHKTKEGAIKKAEEMKQKRITSLKKRIEELEKMKFEE